MYKGLQAYLDLKVFSVNGRLKMNLMTCQIFHLKFCFFVKDIHQQQLILGPALFDQCHLDSLNDGSSWQGDSLALTEDEVTVLMEEIEEEQDLKLLDIR